MKIAARLPDLQVYRSVPFILAMEFSDVDLTGASFKSQVRLYDGAPGSPLIDLATVGSAGVQGIWLQGVTEIAGVDVSTVIMRINQSTLATLPNASERDRPLSLAWDMLVTPADGVSERWVYANFLALPGSTQP